ncbi:MAG: hypothetical protein ACJ748_12915 [Flavisolibacter sp.]
MARVFNIYFLFDDTMYNAIVSVRTTPFFTEYTLTNYNESLDQHLPSNKIISKSPEHFMFQNVTTESSEALMKAIINAVSEHLQMMKA